MKVLNNLTIVQVAAPQNTRSGDYYYRVESPGRALSRLEQVKTVVSITNIHRRKEELMREADILILNHVCDPDLLSVIAFRKKRGLVTIFEIGDNIEDVQPWNLTYHFWRNEENKSLYYKLVSACDALQANNHELLNKFGHLNAKHALFPNQMSDLSTEKEKTRNKRLIIGWGGSYGHLDDLKWVAPVLISWFKEHPETKLAIMGSEEIFGIFREIPEKQKVYHKPGTIRDYYDFLKAIDIGLAPLNDTAYNRCRSDVKFIEYSAFRVVPVLQDMAPYTNSDIPGGTRYLFKEPGELVRILNQLASKPELRQGISDKAFEYVRTQRMEDQRASQRLDFYRQLLPKTDKKHEKGNGSLDRLNGYVPYEETEFERNLYNGLIYLETRDMPDKAQHLFLKAEHLAPDNYLPNLFLSRCVKNPVNELQRSLQKNPSSLKAQALLAEAYIKRGETESALNTFREMIEKFPDYDLPYLKCAELLSLLGMSEDAEKLRRIAGSLNLRLRNTAATKETLHKESAAETRSKAELYLIMPRGNNYGWGVCGKYLAREISKLADIKYITQAFSVEDIGDELDYRLLKSLLVSKEDFDRLINSEVSDSNSGTVIQAIQGSDLQPWGPRINSGKKIGYTFFEENILSDNWISNAREYFDIVVTGSKWCEEILQKHGLEKTKTIIQGIEPAIFNAHHNVKEYFGDSFVIFSGGKFELRKGQDLVIRAFKHLQQKYRDVLLVNCWHNHWKTSVETMAMSKHINFVDYGEDFMAFIAKIFEANGINPDKVITISPKPNVAMARIYKNTDIGLFPNRCEGGTNLVLMEYMACGKPAAASFSSGHRDILTEQNAVLFKNMNSMEMKRNGRIMAVWDDPDLDEIIDRLEWAYLHREKLAEIGRTGCRDLGKVTWKETAMRFYELAISL